MKIFISGAPLQMNLGGPSIFHGLVRVLRQVFPGCELVYHENVPATDAAGRSAPEQSGVRIIQGLPRAKTIMQTAWRRRWLGGAPGHTLEDVLVENVRTADLVIDAWGIDYTDRLARMGMKSAWLSKPLLRTAAWLGTPAVHYTASYGPVGQRWMKMAVRQVLGRCCSLVFCREELSRRYLVDCGVAAAKLRVAPDTGLLMPAQRVSVPELDAGRPCLGISVSHQIKRQWKAAVPYLDLMADFCDRAVRQHQVQVLLIPNELADDQYDDRAVARDILARVHEKSAIRLFPAEQYSGPEQKGAIAQCDLFVASRYHSIVAALSMAVPTVVIGWHHKYAELLELFGQTGVGLSSEDCTPDALWNVAAAVWNRRNDVRLELQAKQAGVEQRIFQAGEALKDLVP